MLIKRLLKSLKLFLHENHFFIPYTPDPYWGLWYFTFNASEGPNQVKWHLLRLDAMLTQYDWCEVISQNFVSFFTKRLFERFEKTTSIFMSYHVHPNKNPISTKFQTTLEPLPIFYFLFFSKVGGFSKMSLLQKMPSGEG